MNEEDKNLFQKFQTIMNNKVDNETAIQFFSQLNLNEYNRLIELFENNDFPDIKTETKNKVLLILNRLRSELEKKS